MAFNKGYKVYICATPAGDDDLTQTEFEALTWVEAINVGTLPERGRTESELTYNTLSHGVKKGKGSTNYGSGDFEMTRKGTNAGREAFVAAAATELNHAIKLVAPDATGEDTGDFTATIEYMRGYLTGPTVPSGGDEQADIFRFSFYNNQHLIVAPEEITE